MFGLVITGENSAEKPAVDGLLPVKNDGGLYDSVTGTGENADKVFLTRPNRAYPCWLIEFD